MSSDHVTIGIGIPGLVIVGLLVMAIIAIARRRLGVGLVVGSLLLAMVMASLFFVRAIETSHRVHSVTQSGESSEWRTTWNAGMPGGEITWTDGPPTSFPVGPKSFLRLGSEMFMRPIFFMLMVGALFLGGVVLFARAVSGKHAARVRGEKGEAWQEPRRGGWGQGVVTLGVVLVAAIFGLRFMAGLQMSQRQAAQGREQLARTERDMRARMQSAQHPALQDTRPLETVIEEFEKPRIQLEGAASDGHAVSPAAEAAAVDDHGAADAQSHDARTRASGEAEGSHGPAADEHPADTAAAALGGEQGGLSAGNRIAETVNSRFDQILQKAAKQDSVLILFDAAKLLDFGLTFHDANLSIFDALGSVGLVRIDSPRRLIVLSAESARRIGVDQFQILKDGKSVPLASVASVQVVSNKTVSTGPRPSWVDAPAKRYGDTWREVIEVGEYSTPQECSEVSQRMVTLAVWKHLQELVPGGELHEQAVNLSEPSDIQTMQLADWAATELNRIGIGRDYIRREMITNEHIEEVERSVGKMHRMYTQLEIRPHDDQFMKKLWVQREQTWRVQAVGAFAAVSLSLVGLVWGLLQVDTMTKGYYSKRLFLGVPGVIALAILLFSVAVS